MEEQAVENAVQNAEVAPPAPDTTKEVAPTKDAQAPETSSNEEAPKEMSDEQARSFQEMRLEIKRLKEEKKAREKAKSALEEVTPTPSPMASTQTDVDINKFVDPETGALDAVSYGRAVNEAIQKGVAQAHRAATSATQQQLEQADAFRAYPALDPESDEYDSDFDEEVAARLLHARYIGSKVSLRQLAEKVAAKYQKTAVKAKEEGAKQAIESLSVKEQASLETARQTSASARQEQSESEKQSLRERVKSGDEDALAQRISRVPWTKRSDEG